MCPLINIMTKTIIDFCEKYNMFPESGIVLCAVSGGKDSMCLLEMLRELAPKYGFELCCAHFDHRLRGEESDRDRKFVEDYCQSRNIPCHIGSADVAAYADENGLGTEEAARELRYAFLEKTADEIGAVRIATAHTANDNAETLLFNLSRGSGLKGICGIPPVRGRIVRPMLELTTAEVLSWLDEKGIPHVEDSTNSEDEYSRNKIRHRVIPELQDINSAFDENLKRCTALLREDEEFLSSLARSFADSNYRDGSVSAKELSALPRPVSARFLRLVIKDGVSEKHIEAIRKLASSEACHSYTDIPGMRVAREYDRLVFDVKPITLIEKRELCVGKDISVPEAGFEISCEFIKNCKEIHNSFNIFSFQSDSICGKIFVKSRSDGEKIRLSGRNCTKSIKKLFSEAQLNGERKARVPVFCDEKGVIAVYGFGIAERCLPKKGDNVIKVTVKSI